MISKKFRFPYSIREYDGSVFYVDDSIYLSRIHDDQHKVYDVKSHKNFSDDKLNDKTFDFSFFYKNHFYFSYEEEGSKQCLKYSYADSTFKEVAIPQFGGQRLGIRNDVAFFTSYKGIYAVSTENFDSFQILPNFKGIDPHCTPALGTEAMVFYSEYQVLSGYSLDGEQLWSKTLEDFDIHPKPDFWTSPQQFGREIEGWKNFAIFQVKPFQAVCIDMSTGEQRWAVEHCVDFQYCVADGVLYGIANGVFTSVDIETGDVILSVPIEKEWIQRGVVESRPISAVKATRTHLWCGFAQAQGVCAINRETGQIDYQEFLGLTLNLDPKIRSNQIFLSFAAGGIGLNTQSGGNYVLIGDGGFIEDEEKDVFY